MVVQFTSAYLSLGEVSSGKVWLHVMSG